MKFKKKISLILLTLIIFQTLSSFSLLFGNIVYAATKTITGPASNLHRQHAPNDFPATLSGNRWIHSTVNTERAAWHNTKTSKQQLIVDGGQITRLLVVSRLLKN